jgi:cell division protease FtsH
LANLVNEAALLAVRREKKKVSRDEFIEAVERVIGGLEKKNRLINEKERRIVAYHETGHALVGLSVPGADRVQKITIVPRGVAALGYTMNVPTEERFLMTKSELLAKIAMALGGRAAEDVVFGDVSTGAHNDLSKATNIARSMVKEYGMDEEIGHTYLENERRAQFLDIPGAAQPKEFSEQTAKAVDDSVKRILEEQYEKAMAVLRERRVVLEEGAELLLSKEKIEGGELEAIMKKHGFNPLDENPMETTSF